MSKLYKTLILAALCLILLPSCRKTTAQTASSDNQITLLGEFSADSAFNNIVKQISFGPRVPGTEAHDACANYIVDELTRFGADSIYIQQAEVVAFNGDTLPMKNIIGCFNAEAPKRVLLIAHYDTRPWADRENDSSRRPTPIQGANDGASGVAVLLEIARNLHLKPAEIGVDMLFVDVEDYGNPDAAAPGMGDWCLGSQYWANNMVPYTRHNLPEYGILLDMVGGTNACFNYEGHSQTYAQAPTAKVWSEAEKLGHGQRFPKFVGGSIIDDHVFINEAGIPTTDIVETYNEVTGSFPPTWHTLDDNIDNIDRTSLEAVGQTVLNVLYKEEL